MNERIKNIFKLLVPQIMWSFFKRKWFYFKELCPIIKQQLRYWGIKKRIKRKSELIKILFVITDSSQWKLCGLYESLKQTGFFEVSVLICPIISERGESHMRRMYKRCVDYFKKIEVDYFLAYNIENNSFNDISFIKPDIVYYITPFPNYRYGPEAFHDALLIYSPYFFVGTTFTWNLGGDLFYSKLWKYFIECEANRKEVCKYSIIKGMNSVVTGYPSCDLLCSRKNLDYSEWRYGESNRKRVIWSPHHSIPGVHYENFSTFLSYYDNMLNMAEKYKNEIEIVFKPHPLLKYALYQHPQWGKIRTDAYYEKWFMGENISLQEDDYIELFRTSDAILNDSNSFMIEYLYTQKPALYLDNGKRLSFSNEVGLAAYNAHYHAGSFKEIESFLLRVVLGGKDEMKKQRKDFFDKYLLPPNGKTVTENILSEIINGIGLSKKLKITT